MFRLLKALPLALALAALTFFAASCGSSSTKYRVVDTIPDSPVGLDFDVNTAVVFSDISFGSVNPSTGYQKVSSGSQSIEVVQTGQTTPVINTTSLSFGGSNEYTLVLTGRYGSTIAPSAPQAVLFTDNNTLATTGDVEFRIIHASPSTTSVNVYLVPPGTDITPSQVTPQISGVAFQAASPSYISLAPATYAAIVTYAGTKQILLSQDYTLTAGQIRTLVLVDTAGGGPPPQWLELSDLN